MAGTKPVTVTFSGKIDWDNGELDFQVYSQYGKQLDPTEKNGTEGKVEDVYDLVLDQNFIVVCKNINEEGEHSCFAAEVEVHKNETWDVIRHLDEIPSFVYPPLCECLMPRIKFEMPIPVR